MSIAWVHFGSSTRSLEANGDNAIPTSISRVFSKIGALAGVNFRFRENYSNTHNPFSIPVIFLVKTLYYILTRNFFFVKSRLSSFDNFNYMYLLPSDSPFFGFHPRRSALPYAVHHVSVQEWTRLAPIWSQLTIP